MTRFFYSKYSIDNNNKDRLISYSYTISYKIILCTYTLLMLVYILLFHFKDPGYYMYNKTNYTEYEDIVPTFYYERRIYTLKYCNTCNIVRDLRVFHCKYCNHCVFRHGKYFLLI